MKKFSPGLLPTVMTIPAVFIMLALSVWQVDRYFWKVNLLDTLQQQLAADGVQLPSGDLSVDEWGYRRVTLNGEFQHDQEIHLFAHTLKGRKGFQIITPFVRSGGKGTVLVNRGWVPEEKKEAAARPEGNIRGEIEISGIARKPWEKSYSFLPESNAETNVWLYGELDDMAKTLGITVSPLFVELDVMTVPGGLPIGGQTRMSVPNNHIEYAVTWFGMGGAMFVIYLLFGFRRARPTS
ncbi:MAG: SURF1 family protein [Sneathiella sp.]